jgi:hypothetical protein
MGEGRRDLMMALARITIARDAWVPTSLRFSTRSSGWPGQPP